MKKISYILMTALVAVACGSKDNPSEDKTETQAPANPAGLALHGDPDETSLTFQWGQVEGAKGYNWKIEKDSQAVKDGKTTSRNVKVDGLEKATEYSFSVQAVADGKTSGWVSVKARTAGSVEPVDPVDPVQDLTQYYSRFGIPEVEEDGQPRAFPGAEGGGMYTTGGRGGKVYHVTSLGDSAGEQGTLRYGIEKGERPLIIVFDVAGTIALDKQLQIKKGDLTIAGQTAPGDGICLKNYTFRIHADNVVVRFIRCRMGDEKQTEDDAMQVMDKYGDSFRNIIIDHCSVSWSTDECASFYGMKDFTFQWNIVSESLRNSVHGKGSHGYGGIWGGTNATYHHNLLAHHDSRNPRIDHDYVSHQKGPVSIFNNVVYNWKGNTCYGGESSSSNGSEYRKYNFFNNYYKPGPATPANHIWFLEPTTSCSNCGGTILPGHFYMDGNLMYGKSDYSSDNWSTSAVHASQGTIDKIREAAPFGMDCYQSIHSAQNSLDPVLEYAGASFHRDGIDTRIAGETRNGTSTYTGSNGSAGGLIDTQTDVQDAGWENGWPVYTFDAGDGRLKDSDSDGMPNWFEEEFGLQKSSAADAQEYSLDPQKRYTNLEMYLHYLVKDIVAGQNAGATYKTL